MGKQKSCLQAARRHSTRPNPLTGPLPSRCLLLPSGPAVCHARCLHEESYNGRRGKVPLLVIHVCAFISPAALQVWRPPAGAVYFASLHRVYLTEEPQLLIGSRHKVIPAGPRAANFNREGNRSIPAYNRKGLTGSGCGTFLPHFLQVRRWSSFQKSSTYSPRRERSADDNCSRSQAIVGVSDCRRCRGRGSNRAAGSRSDKGRDRVGEVARSRCHPALRRAARLPLRF